MHYAYPLCSLCIFFIISMQHLKLYTKCYTDLEMVCYLCIELIIYMWPLLHQWKTRFNCKVFKYEFDFVFSPFSLNIQSTCIFSLNALKVPSMHLFWYLHLECCLFNQWLFQDPLYSFINILNKWSQHMFIFVTSIIRRGLL